MFHLQYPASRHFMTWDELGCLSRALGLPADLFKNCTFTDDVSIKREENGMEIKHILRALELNLLCNDLHLTYNMHPADWNTRAIRSALRLLVHRVLNFDGLRDVRVAYETYENTDMKGMELNTLVILRALKLCGRVIAPLKLKHRIKHMKADFLEPHRIQLDEFFRLILWCDLYKAYSHGDTETASGKNGDLFQVVDFAQLLSHHDERLANSLNAKFVQEDRNYETQELGPKDMFQDSTVNTQLTTQQVQQQKVNYQPIKSEISQSERRLLTVIAGNVRSRPIIFPDFDKYRQSEKCKTSPDLSVQSASVSVQKRFHSAPPTSERLNMSANRPQVSETTRQHRPRPVASCDLRDIQNKLENLLFDVSTLETRCQVQVENEMMFYIPGYLQKLANKPPDAAETPPPRPVKKQRHWTSEIMQGFVQPCAVNPVHTRTCDARFRGWHKVSSTPGYNFVLTSQTGSASKRGTLAKIRQRSSASRLSSHSDYVIRFTSRLRSSPQGRLRAHDSGL